MKRRDHIKGLMLLPLAGSALPLNSIMAAPLTSADDSSSATDPKSTKPNIFQSIGVEPIINCRGTFTIIGGSVERPAGRACMEGGSEELFPLAELAGRAGQRLAQLY